ncbi:zinc ribbon domain-containing protein [Rothia sp. AR01]|uniref:Zinc ribbon domain-containing protein n=1 Tax=Rothia santali TaxID=2949643 RepID=A0A9X2KHK0_9MICC|nr:FmdB family zinc ribbon protein [Rothia santali]MCP3424869.1 zinc ribbon domain-containing protein [Rothia santali]
MPVYAYQCKSCQHRFDIRQSFADAALTECPECHRDELRKKFNTVGVSFKGSGFYSTDAKASSSAGASSGSSTGSGSGSDS